ncbi:MAG: ABC transporter substrate-binding protein [Parvibaculaceae bacterium]
MYTFKCLFNRVIASAGWPALAICGLIPMAAIGAGAALAQSTTIVVNSSGGAIDEAYKACFWDDFERETGIKVQSVGNASQTLAGLKAQVGSGNVEWDLTEIYDTEFGIALANNLLDKLDLGKLPTGSWEKEWYNDYGVWELPYGTVLVYSTEKWPNGGPQPESVTDLWNVEQFPGPRAIQNNPYDNLEYAMQKAGKAPYPIDYDTAFAELDKLKPHVGVYWTTGAQSTQLMQTGQVDMATMWNGRAFSLLQQNLPVNIVWKGASLHVSYWSVPKGAPHYDAAMKLLAYMYDPANAEKDACFAKKIGYAIPNKRLAEVLDAKTLSALPTSPENLKVQHPVDAEWWTKNLDEATRRWQEWTAK